MATQKPVIVLGPTQPVVFSIYRITLGTYVYIGYTQDIHNRAHRHATDARRIVGQMYLEVDEPMIVRHVDEANTIGEARVVERAYIKREFALIGDRLLNNHHANKKR